MLNNYSESDFYELRIIASDSLSPDGISAFFWGSLIYSGIMTAVVLVGMGDIVQIINPIWPKIIRADLVILVIQLLITLFFTNEINAFKFQRFQAILISIISFKVSIDAYQVFYLACEDRNAPSFIRNTGNFLLLGGIVYLIVLTIRGIGRVKQGEFRKGGKLLYNFRNSKAFVIFPIIYAATLLGIIIMRNFSNMTSITAKLWELIYLVIVIAVFQYVLAMACPPIFLLTYCKFRFKSFRVKMPESFKRRPK